MITKVDYKNDFNHPHIQVDYHWYSRDYSILHIHNYWEFFIVYDGEVTQTLNGAAKRMSKSELCLIRPSDEHKLTNSNENYSQINFMAVDSLIKNLLDTMDAGLYDRIINYNGGLYFSLNNAKDELFFENIKRLFILEKNNIAKKTSIIKFLFTYIFNVIGNFLTSGDSSYPAWLNNFIDDIRKEENISKKTAELCRLTNYSHSHLIRLVKKFTSKTLIEIVRDAKLNYALNLLEKTDFAILQIAGKVGYDSLSHFIAAFKKKFSYAPEAYRRLLRSEQIVRNVISYKSLHTKTE